jgi:D-threitol dehydrogenase (NAD+)
VQLSHTLPQAGTIGLADHGAYCASKAALDSLTRVMTVEWAPHGIQCNSVAPTVVMTEMGKRVWGGAAGEPMRNRTPMRRFAEPEEVRVTSCACLLECVESLCVLLG